MIYFSSAAVLSNIPHGDGDFSSNDFGHFQSCSNDFGHFQSSSTDFGHFQSSSTDFGNLQTAASDIVINECDSNSNCDEEVHDRQSRSDNVNQVMQNTISEEEENSNLGDEVFDCILDSSSIFIILLYVKQIVNKFIKNLPFKMTRE